MYTAEEVPKIPEQALDRKKILIIESNDLSETSLDYTEDLKDAYKSAKIAQLKQGGNYPFLCDVTLRRQTKGSTIWGKMGTKWGRRDGPNRHQPTASRCDLPL